jgi:ketosteroid isomerase-like protein
MKTIGLLLVPLLPVCCAPRAFDPVHAAFPESQEDVRRALRDLLDAAEQKDFPRLEGMHLYGPKFSRWDARSPTRQDAEATRQAERAGIEPLDSFRAAAEDLKVDVFGEVAVATFAMPYEATRDGQTTSSRVKATLVWVKTESGWKVAHEHLSAFPQPP